MTKEAILNKHDTSRHYIEQTCRPELFAAMDEYAKQQAIAFLKFCIEKEHISTDFVGTHNIYFDGNYFDDPSFDESAPTIYNQFIEQQQNK